MARQRTALDDTLERLPAAFTREAALDAGLTRALLDRLIHDGEIERFGRGLLLRPGATAEADLDLLEAVLRSAQATICLSSALAHHDLTDEIPSRTHLAVPRGAHRPSGPATVSWHTFDPHTFAVGRTQSPVSGGLTIGLYNPERSIIDAFNPRIGSGSDIAVEALRRWLRRPGSQPSRLLSMATSWPHARAPLMRALQVLL
jgi:predicted transcriptional regulator of viral defense system